MLLEPASLRYIEALMECIAKLTLPSNHPLLMYCRREDNTAIAVEGQFDRGLCDDHHVLWKGRCDICTCEEDSWNTLANPGDMVAYHKGVLKILFNGKLQLRNILQMAVGIHHAIESACDAIRLPLTLRAGPYQAMLLLRAQIQSRERGGVRLAYIAAYVSCCSLTDEEGLLAQCFLVTNFMARTCEFLGKGPAVRAESAVPDTVLKANVLPSSHDFSVMTEGAVYDRVAAVDGGLFSRNLQQQSVEEVSAQLLNMSMSTTTTQPASATANVVRQVTDVKLREDDVEDDKGSGRPPQAPQARRGRSGDHPTPASRQLSTAATTTTTTTQSSHRTLLNTTEFRSGRVEQLAVLSETAKTLIVKGILVADDRSTEVVIKVCNVRKLAGRQTCDGQPLCVEGYVLSLGPLQNLAQVVHLYEYTCMPIVNNAERVEAVLLLEYCHQGTCDRADDVIPIVRSLLQVCADVNDLGLRHGDICLHNIAIQGTVVRLLDFEMAIWYVFVYRC
eukprot:TRINITY_DN3051_c0_g3_i3.p1 TRINITY_DN3051_c0_g3~~TRINITY_DN3051_c0_g3_i3.p1  ORF type:complete len:504 (-),score=90.69 TRINITY_DN3051_c0_g3_i3:276-1787(-)